jgi:hypothetical protein
LEDFMKPRTLIFAFTAFLVILALVPQASLAQICELNMPTPVLTFLGTEPVEGGTYYNLSVSNWQLYPAEFFVLGDYQCGDNQNASRTFVEIYGYFSSEVPTRIYGFCVFEHPQDLTTLWFFIPDGDATPDQVYIKLIDNACERFRTSDPVPIFEASPNGYGPISVLIDPNGGTNLYPFDNNLFNYKVTYPPLDNPPVNDVFLVVQPILISQGDLNTLLGEGAFAGAELVPYDGTAGGNSGVLFRATCEDSNQNPTDCPTPGVYDVKTSWNSTSAPTAPAFLKAEIGSQVWENIFTTIVQDRIDPTGSGRTCCKYSEFVFVDGVTGTLPTITITTPQQIAYTINQPVLANYDCSILSNPLVTGCLGTVGVGSAIDTSSPGAKTFQVNATVSSGPSAEQTVSYKVVYNTDSCLLYDPNRSVKKGAAYPIKLQVCDAAGKNLSAPNIVLHAVTPLIKLDSTPDGPPIAAGNANPDSDFRFNSGLGVGGGYIYNLKTNNLSTGTWKLQFKITGDPVTHYALFNVK